MNLGSDDNRVFFIWGVLGGGDAAFWREKEETDEMTGGKKWTVWSPTSERAPVWIKCRFLKKLWNQPACASHHHQPPAHTRAHTITAASLVLNYGGCYQSHFKSVRGDEGLFTFQKRWYSLFTEKHIQLSTLRYQPATILETACILCISLFESHMATKMEIMWLNDVWGWLI